MPLSLVGQTVEMAKWLLDMASLEGSAAAVPLHHHADPTNPSAGQPLLFAGMYHHHTSNNLHHMHATLPVKQSIAILTHLVGAST
jgi:hypothetical protein